jgi:hypothetical protein
MSEPLIPYAVKRPKAKPTAAQRPKALRAWRPDRGFTPTELKDSKPHDAEEPIPRKPRGKR